MHGRTGKITNIRDHEDGKHAEITVTHGKRKRDKYASTKGDAPLVSYNQHRSTLTIPKAHAKNYALGQSVNAGIEPSEEAGELGDDNEMDESQNGAVSQAAATPGKSSGVSAAKSTKARSRLLGALKGKKK